MAKRITAKYRLVPAKSNHNTYWIERAVVKSEGWCRSVDWHPIELFAAESDKEAVERFDKRVDQLELLELRSTLVLAER